MKKSITILTTAGVLCSSSYVSAQMAQPINPSITHGVITNISKDITSASFSMPFEDFNANEITVGVDYGYLKTTLEDRGTIDLAKTRNTAISVNYAMNSKVAVGINEIGGRISDLYTVYRPLKQTSIVLGVKNYHTQVNCLEDGVATHYTGNENKTKPFVGIGQSYGIAENVKFNIYGSKSSVSNEWYTGISYELPKQPISFSIGYKNYKEDNGNFKMSGVNFGVKYLM